MSDRDAPEHEDHSGLRGKVEDLLKSAVRRTWHQGADAARLTEDILRQKAAELRLPREVVAYLFQTIDGTRRELIRVTAREFRDFLERANLTEEIAKLLTTLSLEVRMEVRFIPNDEAIKPNVRSRVAVRNRRRAASPASPDTPPSEGGVIGEDMEESGGALEEALREVATDVVQRLWRGFARRGDSDDEETQHETSSSADLDASTPGDTRERPKRAPAATPRAAGPSPAPLTPPEPAPTAPRGRSRTRRKA